MDIKSFVQNFAEQFDDIDTSGFTPETQFKENEEWSSMTALSVIAMVDQNYSVQLTGNDIRGSSTILDIFNIVSEKVKQ